MALEQIRIKVSVRFNQPGNDVLVAEIDEGRIAGYLDLAGFSYAENPAPTHLNHRCFYYRTSRGLYQLPALEKVVARRWRDRRSALRGCREKRPRCEEDQLHNDLGKHYPMAVSSTGLLCSHLKPILKSK